MIYSRVGVQTGSHRPPSRGGRLVLRLLVVWVVAANARLAEACSVCFGNPDSPQTHGMNSAILLLLAVTVGVLAAFASFFIYLLRRSRLVAGGVGHGVQFHKETPA